MIKYFFRKKKAEWKVKALLYETLGSFLDNQELIAKFADIIREDKNSAEATGGAAKNAAENTAGI